MVDILDDQMENLENAKTQMRKGVLELCILGIVARTPTYAPEILAELGNVGIAVVEGTLYPLLNRLKREEILAYKWQESSSGPPRKYYNLTSKGKKYLQELKKNWYNLHKAIESLEKRKKELPQKVS